MAGVNAIREWWAKSPAYLVVAPDTAPKFPTDVVVGSQQRWLVCKSFKPEQISAIDAFVNEYRGRGPEQIPAKDAGGDSALRAACTEDLRQGREVTAVGSKSTVLEASWS